MVRDSLSVIPSKILMTPTLNSQSLETFGKRIKHYPEGMVRTFTHEEPSSFGTLGSQFSRLNLFYKSNDYLPIPSAWRG